MDNVLESADLDVKIKGVKSAVEKFIDDPTQSMYARVYMEKCVEVYDSIIADFERDCAMLQTKSVENSVKLEEALSELGWIKYPDQMGK